MSKHIRTFGIAIALACLGVLTLQTQQSAIGRSFFVSPQGNNANAGTLAAPWRSIGMANLTVQAGDTVIVVAGTYDEPVSPLASGTPTQPIVYRNRPGDAPLIKAARGISIRSGSSHVIVEGLTVEATERMAEVEGASFITIQNCRLFGGKLYETFLLHNASYCRILNNFLDRRDPVGEDGADGLKVLGKSHHNLIEGNVVTGCGHQGMGSSYAEGPKEYNVFRNNLVYNCHTDFGFEEGVDRYLVEGNVSYYPGLVYTPDGGHSLQVSGTRNTIYRYNVFYDDTASIAPTDIVQQVIGTSSFPYHDMAGMRFYNNTMYGESDETYKRYVFRIDDNYPGHVVDGNVLKNNILARSTLDAPVINEESSFRPTSALNTVYDGNLLWQRRAGDVLVRLQGNDGVFFWTLPQAKQARPGFWLPGNIEGDPLFVNTVAQGPGKDFRLRTGSPAIDAGVHLTVTTNAGVNAATVKVADASYFVDGWGIIEADSLRIEGASPSSLVRIAAVDYATNTITLTGPRTWNANARVWYYRSDRFRGAAPDAGAKEFQGEETAKSLSAPSLQSPPQGATGLGASTTLQWGPVVGATGYLLEVARSVTFDSIVVRQAGVLLPAYTLEGLEQDRTYFWHVAATGDGSPSEWSAVYRFSTAGQSSPVVSLIRNAGFDEGPNGWSFYTDGQGEFLVEPGGYQGTPSGLVRIARTGNNVQLRQTNLALQPNGRYRISFAAKASVPREIEVSFLKDVAPFSNYGLFAFRVGLTAGWQLYETQFVTRNVVAGATDGRLMFWFGASAQPGDEFSVDNVVLSYVGQVSETPSSLPTDFALLQNYPNPFNPSTTIAYYLPATVRVLLVVRDLLGREVRRLVDGTQLAGEYTVRMDGTGMASGVYFCVLQAGSFVDIRRMVLLR